MCLAQTGEPNALKTTWSGDVQFIEFNESKDTGGMAAMTHTKYSVLSHSPAKSASISDGKILDSPGQAAPMGYQQSRRRKRVLFFDQIKALMIALVIAVHILLTFIGSFMGVHIPIGESPHPVFGGLAAWFLLFCNTFFMYITLWTERCQP